MFDIFWSSVGLSPSKMKLIGMIGEGRSFEACFFLLDENGFLSF